ncbi:uncharacterized protein K452DRAFT_302654 [Aplosporella prunicola CBS 121167]|uniref:Uncharacterized protein n=1 Tax=Aplosporella prunicola CBS 121167 TaxID=1176127 RepID=A0A6A6B0L7_9PEZI|nr:uncharacterized protein K452DRAFT_302654 [Aplosporella prunicola CBS 121167]KAF2136577.1 hypothetical protein K452DRAFT_302654 [Aplosporella prunicola CBS 121167]
MSATTTTTITAAAVNRLPEHTQQQLAALAERAAPLAADIAASVSTTTTTTTTNTDGSPNLAQYQAALAARYRANIQRILKPDMNSFAAESTASSIDAAIAPAPTSSTPNGSAPELNFLPSPSPNLVSAFSPASSSPSPSYELATYAATNEDVDPTLATEDEEDEHLPPYEEEEGNTSDCTVTVTELDSPDTPADNIDQADMLRTATGTTASTSSSSTTGGVAIRPASATSSNDGAALSPSSDGGVPLPVSAASCLRPASRRALTPRTAAAAAASIAAAIAATPSPLSSYVPAQPRSHQQERERSPGPPPRPARPTHTASTTATLVSLGSKAYDGPMKAGPKSITSSKAGSTKSSSSSVLSVSPKAAVAKVARLAAHFGGARAYPDHTAAAAERQTQQLPTMRAAAFI